MNKYDINKIILVLIICLLISNSAHSQGYKVSIIELDDAVINPVSARYLTKSISQASQDGSQCLIIIIDTPGGLQKSMELMYEEILNSPIPIVVYVAPEGSQATSAGVFIALSAHILAMAPGTKIGSAHPIALGGGEMDDDIKKKIVEHTVAEVKKIAELRERNVGWAEQSVRESISSTWKEALDENVIDFIAVNIDDLLTKIDGRKVAMQSGERTLHTRNVKIEYIRMNMRDRLLNIISDPNIAYMLLILGFYGIFFELSNPGTILPGVFGGISIILAFFALQTLPVNYAGVLLILLSIILFILEVRIASYGMLTIGGIISMLLGSLMLIDTSEPYAYIFRVSFQIILPAIIITAAFFILCMILVIRTHRKKVVTGKAELINSIGICKTEINPEGKVFIHGELWRSVSDEKIEPNERVKVIGIDGFTLRVKRLDRNEGDHSDVSL